jgi:hypothetical protein
MGSVGALLVMRISDAGARIVDPAAGPSIELERLRFEPAIATAGEVALEPGKSECAGARTGMIEV